MKKALATLLLGTAACTNTKTDPAPTPNPHSVSWQVDSQRLTVEDWVSLRGPGSVITVYGREYVNGAIASEVQFELPSTVGTYDLGASSSAWATYRKGGVKYLAGKAPGATGLPGSGTLVLTSVANQEAIGTFSFTAIDPATNSAKTVSGGKFQVPI
jgi:hypothetical protein